MKQRERDREKKIAWHRRRFEKEKIKVEEKKIKVEEHE